MGGGYGFTYEYVYCYLIFGAERSSFSSASFERMHDLYLSRMRITSSVRGSLSNCEDEEVPSGTEHGTKHGSALLSTTRCMGMCDSQVSLLHIPVHTTLALTSAGGLEAPSVLVRASRRFSCDGSEY